MIKVSVLTVLSEAQFKAVAHLWELTGIGNVARGDSYEAVCKTLANGARIILVYDDETAVGTVWLTHDFRRMYLHHMAVHPDFQNRGFGHKLMEEALKIAGELNLQVKLEVHDSNQNAYHLYKKFGFTTDLESFKVMIKRDI